MKRIIFSYKGKNYYLGIRMMHWIWQLGVNTAHTTIRISTLYLPIVLSAVRVETELRTEIFPHHSGQTGKAGRAVCEMGKKLFSRAHLGRGDQWFSFRPAACHK